MTTTLVMTPVDTDEELDRVSLVDGHLSYKTGRAKGPFESLRANMPDASDEELLNQRSDWSNGYLMFKPAGDSEE